MFHASKQKFELLISSDFCRRWRWHVDDVGRLYADLLVDDYESLSKLLHFNQILKYRLNERTLAREDVKREETANDER